MQYTFLPPGKEMREKATNSETACFLHCCQAPPNIFGQFSLKKTETVGIKFTKATEINDNEHILY
jgi:hypothetical protein